jgi:hypothetical protein
MTSSGMQEEKRTSGTIVAELKAISHDVFNLMTVMYGLQETLQGVSAEDEAFSRALSDFNQVVTKMQQIGDRMLKVYREEGGLPPKPAK